MPVSMLGKTVSIIAGMLGVITIGLVAAIATLSLRSAVTAISHQHPKDW